MFLTDRDPRSTAVGQQTRSAPRVQPTSQSVTGNESRRSEYTPPARGQIGGVFGSGRAAGREVCWFSEASPGALRSLAPRGPAHKRDGEVAAWTNLKGACPEGR
jgi:hypothetical protein